MCSNGAYNPQLLRSEVLHVATASADHFFTRTRVRTDDHSCILDADLLNSVTPIPSEIGWTDAFVFAKAVRFNDESICHQSVLGVT